MRKSFIFSAIVVLILSGCAAPKIVDVSCEAMPRGTAHVEDTMGTKRWMRTYEVARRARCK